jgi:hypothetical protein
MKCKTATSLLPAMLGFHRVKFEVRKHFTRVYPVKFEARKYFTGEGAYFTGDER